LLDSGLKVNFAKLFDEVQLVNDLLRVKLSDLLPFLPMLGRRPPVNFLPLIIVSVLLRQNGLPVDFLEIMHFRKSICSQYFLFTSNGCDTCGEYSLRDVILAFVAGLGELSLGLRYFQTHLIHVYFAAKLFQVCIVFRSVTHFALGKFGIGGSIRGEILKDK
jgi:hypothetical protein